MELKVLTVYFGGEWKIKDDCCGYVGDFISKAFVIDNNMHLDALRKLIMKRFNINSTMDDISLTHLHPFQKLKNPYMIDTEEDYKSFLDINEASQVSWTLPLYVSSSKKMSQIERSTNAAQHSNARLQSNDSFLGADVEKNGVDADCVDKNQPELAQSSEGDEGNNLSPQEAPQADWGSLHADCHDRSQLEIVQSSEGDEDNHLAPPADSGSLHDDCDDRNQPDIVQSSEGDEGNHVAPLADSDFPNADCADKNQPEMVPIYEEDERNQLALSEDRDFLCVGQFFKSKHELVNAVKSMAIRENFVYRVKKSSLELYKLKCVDAECKWKMRATKLKGTNYFEIRIFNDRHTCSPDVRRPKQISYHIVGEKIKARYEGVRKGPTPKMICNDMQNEFDQNVSYWKAWKAQEWAQNLIRGTAEENYAMLPAYCHMLKQVNHGTHTCLEIDDFSRFKYVFISIGASVRGFHHLRKVIMVDSAFLNGKYERILMIVNAQDGNQELYPLAFAVVDSENDSSWMWFFQQLLDVVPCSNDLVFVSDQNLSIETAIKSVYISAKHVFCIRQLKENLKSMFKGQGIRKLLTKAAESYTITDFEEYFQNICSINMEMGKYLRDLNFQKWSRAHCRSDRYNIMTANGPESIDSILKEARSYQIVALLEYIRDLLSRWFYERREKAERNNKQLPPNVKKILETRYMQSSMYDVRMVNENQFEVADEKFYGVVDLSQKTCCCKVFDLDHIPCAHALAAIQHMKYKMADFVSEYYQFNSWYMTYQETINPVPRKSVWVVPEDVINIECSPPLMYRKRGRPGKPRLPDVEDFARNVIHKTIKCSSCETSGHSRKTCPNNSSSKVNMTAEIQTRSEQEGDTGEEMPGEQDFDVDEGGVWTRRRQEGRRILRTQIETSHPTSRTDSPDNSSVA